MLKKLLRIYPVFRDSARVLASNDLLRMAGATAFFTTFALPPVLMIIVRAFGLFFDKRTIGRKILGKVGSVIGEEGRMQILSVIKGVNNFQLTPLATFMIFVFLLFVSTTLFVIVRNSINQLWNIRVNKKRAFSSVMLARLKAVGIILFTGVLFLAVMAIDMMQAYLGPYLYEISPMLGQYVYSATNHIVSLLVTTAWFFILFRYLPDGRPIWTTALVGGFVTGLLFTIGKYALQWILSGNIQAIYGTSGALVFILLFVFYSSMMLYFGAAFTKEWALYFGNDIEPLPHAARYHILKGDADHHMPVAE